MVSPDARTVLLCIYLLLILTAHTLRDHCYLKISLRVMADVTLPVSYTNLVAIPAIMSRFSNNGSAIDRWR